MNIREATKKDFEAIWPIFSEIVKAGVTYGYPTDATKEQALEIWIKAPGKAFVYEENGKILGTYYIKTNQAGPGDHVCNCGYMVSSDARGRGVATAMCEHSQTVAKQLGYKAMQFNFVVSSNEVAVSYLFIAIVWTNHHYLMRYAAEANTRLLWFNFAHLFSMSLLPLSTDWMAVSELAPQPVVFTQRFFPW